uniref:Uncharacterized protein n=1 Tax=Microviridae sp. ctemt10 TaxID=2827647 RepID=A0A8S5TLV8_9VIRU|nr:MAG TPA: hypothetical protein [Microviridae sp. ctemt10]
MILFKLLLPAYRQFLLSRIAGFLRSSGAISSGSVIRVFPFAELKKLLKAGMSVLVWILWVKSLFVVLTLLPRCA